MEKFYSYVAAFYRLSIIGVFVYLHFQANPHFATASLIMYASFALYAVLFTLLRSTKWSAYAELLALIFLIVYYEQASLYYLLLLPVVTIASSRTKTYDLILFSSLLGGFIHLQANHVWFSLFTGFGMFAALLLFNSKFKHIEVLERKLFQSRKSLRDAEKELASREMELENVLKMFMRSKELNEIKEEQEIVKALVSSAKEFSDAYYVCLYLYQGGAFHKYVEAGKNDRYETPQTLGEGEAEADYIRDDSLQTVIHHQGERWGVLRVYGKVATFGKKEQKVFIPFNELDHELLLTYVDQAMIKLKEVQLLQKNEYLANNDFLTGVPNRRYFIERFEQFAAMAARGEHFSIMILDIDDFKQVNDKYGHDTGDAVLKVVAETLQEAIRDKYDVVGRIGGEEFGVLLFNPNDQSYLVADRIRRLIAAVPAMQQITVSVGLAYYGEDGTTWEELYNNADQALYYAKGNGKNQVIEYRSMPKNG